MKTTLFYETTEMVKSSSTFLRICCTFMHLWILILLLSLLLMVLTSSFLVSLLVALVANSDWLTGEDVSDDALNL